MIDNTGEVRYYSIVEVVFDHLISTIVGAALTVAWNILGVIAVCLPMNTYVRNVATVLSSGRK